MCVECALVCGVKLACPIWDWIRIIIDKHPSLLSESKVLHAKINKQRYVLIILFFLSPDSFIVDEQVEAPRIDLLMMEPNDDAPLNLCSKSHFYGM